MIHRRKRKSSRWISTGSQTGFASQKTSCIVVTSFQKKTNGLDSGKCELAPLKTSFHIWCCFEMLHQCIFRQFYNNRHETDTPSHLIHMCITLLLVYSMWYCITIHYTWKWLHFCLYNLKQDKPLWTKVLSIWRYQTNLEEPIMLSNVVVHNGIWSISTFHKYIN